MNSYEYKGFTIVQGYSSYFVFSGRIIDENSFIGQRDTSAEAEKFIDELI